MSDHEVTHEVDVALLRLADANICSLDGGDVDDLIWAFTCDEDGSITGLSADGAAALEAFDRRMVLVPRQELIELLEWADLHRDEICFRILKRITQQWPLKSNA